jgi:hypothetical protein
MMSWHESEDSLQEKVTKLKIRSLIERFDRLNFEYGNSIGLCFNDVMARVGRLAPVPFDRLNFERRNSNGLYYNDLLARVGRLAPTQVGRLAPVQFAFKLC